VVSSLCVEPPPSHRLLAAVLDWRLPEPAFTDPGPLPWLPGIPKALHDHPVWGKYLATRSELVIGLATQVRRRATQDGTQPVWAPPGSHPPAVLLGEIAVWRAAVGIDPRDRRPTGAGQLQTAAALWQQRLDRVSPTQATTRRIATSERTRLARESPKTTTATTANITPGGPRSIQRRYRQGLADRRATVNDSSIGRALQVVGRNSRARVITGQPNSP
jgi:hypothetical protein